MEKNNNLKVAIINTTSPFIYGGAEYAVVELVKMLIKIESIDVSLFKLPFPNQFDRDMIKYTIACKALNFDDYDMVIAHKYPAYCIPHRNKVIWLFHQFRQVYELWDTDLGLKSTPENIFLKSFVQKADRFAFDGAKKIFTLSSEVSSRLKKYNGIDSQPLGLPLQDSQDYHLKEYGNFLFYPSRISSFKRQHLAILAIAKTKTNVKLIIAGKSAEPEYLEKLNSIIKEHRLENRVSILGEISHELKIKLFAESLCTIYLPFQEDYGLVTFESGLSSKALITSSDSGGVTEFITHNINGIILDPDPQLIADAIDDFQLNKHKAEYIGKVAREMVLKLNFTWQKVIERIFS